MKVLFLLSVWIACCMALQPPVLQAEEPAGSFIEVSETGRPVRKRRRTYKVASLAPGRLYVMVCGELTVPLGTSGINAIVALKGNVNLILDHQKPVISLSGAVGVGISGNLLGLSMSVYMELGVTYDFAGGETLDAWFARKMTPKELEEVRALQAKYKSLITAQEAKPLTDITPEETQELLAVKTELDAKIKEMQQHFSPWSAVKQRIGGFITYIFRSAYASKFMGRIKGGWKKAKAKLGVVKDFVKNRAALFKNFASSKFANVKAFMSRTLLTATPKVKKRKSSLLLSTSGSNKKKKTADSAAGTGSNNDSGSDDQSSVGHSMINAEAVAAVRKKFGDDSVQMRILLVITLLGDDSGLVKPASGRDVQPGAPFMPAEPQSPASAARVEAQAADRQRWGWADKTLEGNEGMDADARKELMELSTQDPPPTARIEAIHIEQIEKYYERLNTITDYHMLRVGLQHLCGVYVDNVIDYYDQNKAKDPDSLYESMTQYMSTHYSGHLAGIWSEGVTDGSITPEICKQNRLVHKRLYCYSLFFPIFMAPQRIDPDMAKKCRVSLECTEECNGLGYITHDLGSNNFQCRLPTPFPWEENIRYMFPEFFMLRGEQVPLLVALAERLKSRESTRSQTVGCYHWKRNPNPTEGPLITMSCARAANDEMRLSSPFDVYRHRNVLNWHFNRWILQLTANQDELDRFNTALTSAEAQQSIDDSINALARRPDRVAAEMTFVFGITIGAGAVGFCTPDHNALQVVRTDMWQWVYTEAPEAEIAAIKRVRQGVILYNRDYKQTHYPPLGKRKSNGLTELWISLLDGMFQIVASIGTDNRSGGSYERHGDKVYELGLRFIIKFKRDNNVPQSTEYMVLSTVAHYTTELRQAVCDVFNSDAPLRNKLKQMTKSVVMILGDAFKSLFVTFKKSEWKKMLLAAVSSVVIKGLSNAVGVGSVEAHNMYEIDIAITNWARIPQGKRVPQFNPALATVDIHWNSFFVAQVDVKDPIFKAGPAFYVAHGVSHHLYTYSGCPTCGYGVTELPADNHAGEATMPISPPDEATTTPANAPSKQSKE